MKSSHLTHLAAAELPTSAGSFTLHVFRWSGAKPHESLSDEHMALVRGDLTGRARVPVRVHSECLTSEVFGSLKCDCAEQLRMAQERVAASEFGAIVYLRQEGRGIGLVNKIRAYRLQQDGADTIEANEALHLPVDARTYEIAASILGHLGISSVDLMTNNPDKVSALTELGIDVVQRVPVEVPANPHSRGYLDVKRDLMGHHLAGIEPRLG